MWWDTIVLGVGMSVATMGTLPGRGECSLAQTTRCPN